MYIDYGCTLNTKWWSVLALINSFHIYQKSKKLHFLSTYQSMAKLLIIAYESFNWAKYLQKKTSHLTVYYFNIDDEFTTFTLNNTRTWPFTKCTNGTSYQNVYISVICSSIFPLCLLNNSTKTSTLRHVCLNETR